MYRKGVSALIINKKNEFLLVNLKSFETHFFAVPGGGIEGNETLEDAVYREIEEELGIHKHTLEIMGKSTHPLRYEFKTQKLQRAGVVYDGSERHFFGFRFIGNQQDIRVQESEVRSYRWIRKEDLSKYLLFEHQCKDTEEKIQEIFDLD